MRRGLFLTVLGLIATLASHGFGAPTRPALPSAEAVVAAMLTAPTLVDYEGTKVLSEVRGDRAETITVLESYKRLGKLRLQFLSPESVSGRLIVDDGASSWQYEPAYNVAIHGPSFVHLPGQVRNPQEILRGYLAAILGIEEVIGRPTIAVAMEPRAGGANRRYWVDQATGVVLRMEERDVTGEIVFTSFFTRISFGLNLPSALFRFRPPAGARLISLFLSGDPIDSPEALRHQAGFGVVLPPTLPFGYRFRNGTVSRFGALTALAATYTDGVRAVTVFQTPSSQMAFPQVGTSVPPEPAAGRLLDLGYLRVLIWQAHGINYALTGSLPAASLRLIADDLIALRP